MYLGSFHAVGEFFNFNLVEKNLPIIKYDLCVKIEYLMCENYTYSFDVYTKVGVLILGTNIVVVNLTFNLIFK